MDDVDAALDMMYEGQPFDWYFVQYVRELFRLYRHSLAGRPLKDMELSDTDWDILAEIHYWVEKNKMDPFYQFIGAKRK